MSASDHLPASQTLRPATLCIHAGTHDDPAMPSACSPIYPATAYAFPNARNENIYPRYFNTPNQLVVARKVAALEGGEDALVFGSGMAAISTLLLTLLRAGDHAVFQEDVYGGTHHLVTQDLPRLGIAASMGKNEAALAAAVRPNTRLIYVESPSNPLLRCLDLAAVAKLGRERGIVTVIDNTFATPINQQPIGLGIDVVVHSATKYLNGHSDLNAGVVVASGKIIQRLREGAVSQGGMLDSHACAQLERGLKTLDLRVRQHNTNALRIAKFLQAHPAVSRVNYPGLPGHPSHVVAARQMRGFGGMLSFELKDPARVDALLSGLRVILPALSLGGVESLICIPSRTSHRTLTRAEREAAGIGESLVRLSVGLEDVADLEADLDRALAT